jgi:uncharacterized protein
LATSAPPRWRWVANQKSRTAWLGIVTAEEGGIGGGIGPAPEGSAGHVTVYVDVDDPAAYLAKAEQLGGKTVMPPTEVPGFGVTFALFSDPEGHVLGLTKAGGGQQ